jgi:two-component system response regulator RegA
MPAGDAPALLLVDDDETFASVLARTLSRRGYAVHVAANYDAALALAREVRPRYAVLDLKLPGPSGLQLIRPLREVAPEVRIVVLTGFGSIATTVDAIKLGAVYYLSKPAGPDEIVAALHRDDPSETATFAPHGAPSINRLEWEHINRILAETHGNISESARILGLHRRTLQRKLGKHPAVR